MENYTVTHAGFWKRVGAYLIDIFVIAAMGFVLGMILAVLGMTENEGLINVLGFIIAVAYFTTMESSEKQATFGKMVLGIKVVDENGQRISFTKALVRMFSRYLSGLIFGIGYLMVAFTPNKQALHDIIAKTYVINK